MVVSAEVYSLGVEKWKIRIIGQSPSSVNVLVAVRHISRCILMKKYFIILIAVCLIGLYNFRSLSFVTKVASTEMVGSYKDCNTHPYRQLNLMSNGLYACGYCFSGKWANVTGEWKISEGKYIHLRDIYYTEKGLSGGLILPIEKDFIQIKIELNDNGYFYKY